MNEAELVRRARAGEQDAWENLVRDHQEAVFRLAYLITGDPASAEDAAQEAFVRVMRGLVRFDTKRPLRPWLLSIAARMAHNRQRSLGRYLNALRRWAQKSVGNGQQDANVEAEKNLEAVALWKAVRQLRRSDREVIYLRYFLEMSNEETAQALEVAAGTVKSRLHRALGRLKGVIQRDYPELEEAWTR